MCGELELEIEAYTVLKEIEEAMRIMPPEERAYKVVRSFFQTEEPSDKIRTMFFDWMLSPENEEAKQCAMERVFKECLDGTMILESRKK